MTYSGGRSNSSKDSHNKQHKGEEKATTIAVEKVV